jgi:hypothetical protein
MMENTKTGLLINYGRWFLGVRILPQPPVDSSSRCAINVTAQSFSAIDMTDEEMWNVIVL